MAKAGAVLSASGMPPLQWPLVGRADELELFTTTLADPRAHGFVIHGAAGVGKTRLADQCLALADQQGRYVARATATEGSCSTPLGALAHLLPASIGEERSDPLTVMAELRSVLRGQATNGPLVLFVDDVHLLDSTSATLVGQLVDADLVFLVATVRTREDVSAGLESLWHRARVRRIDLVDLDRAAIDELLHVVLQGPVEASTVTEFWEASQGNALFLRELVLADLQGGQLSDHRGVWRLVGPLITTPRLYELVAARLGNLGPAATDALDILAVWEPTGLTPYEKLVGSDQLDVLDRAGLLLVRNLGRRQQVMFAHPLYGEILRDRMPTLRRRRLLLEHAACIEGYGARRREDAIRVAAARLEATGGGDPELLVKAARLARYGNDFVQVERLGQAATLGGVTPEAGLLVGEARHELGRFAEADEMLEAACDAASDDDELLVHITEIRSRNLMWGLRRPAEAIEASRDIRRRLADASAVEELTLNEAMLLTYSGRPLEALALLDDVGELTRPRARALRALAEVPALIAVGRCETAVQEAARAFAEHSRLPDQVAIPSPGTHLVIQAYALTECGRLGEATALASAAYDATPATAPPDARMWLAHQLGRCALVSGRIETARRWLREAVARCEERHSVGPQRLVLSALATADACAGDVPSAEAAIAELDGLPTYPFVEAEQHLGRAWALAAGGDLPGARALLVTAAELAASTGYRTTEAWLRHDVVRLGDPTAVVDRLEALAGLCEGRLVEAYAAHAAAAAGGRPEDLVGVSERFEALGAMLLAAEAATEAAQAYRRAGHRREAAALGVRATTLAGTCEGARTPGLSAPVLVVPLTARERDIASLASQGLASQDIADRLFLSVRTVNNHLQNVYTKLGVSGRRQLVGALAELAEPGANGDPSAST